MKNPMPVPAWIGYSIIGTLVYWGWRYNNDVLFIGGIVVGSIAMAIELIFLFRKILREKKERDKG